MKDRREKNKRKLEKSEYTYFFVPNSEVFHLKTCPSLLRVNGFNGSPCYETAAMGRRPCKRCHPLPEHEKPVKKQASLPKSIEKSEVKLLNGSREWMSSGKIVGVCHNYKHPGAITIDIMREHDCIKKQCQFFGQNPHSIYWREKREIKAAKAQTKKLKQAEQKKADELELLRDKWQEIADDLGMEIHIVRVECSDDKWWFHTIYYVSSRAYADFDEYWILIDCLKSFHPHWSFYMRHIKDVDGHYVTTEEYKRRRRK